MTTPAWRVRPARRSDRARLRRFDCADQRHAWSAEVEHFIRHDLMDWAFAPLAAEDDPRLLLVFDRASRSLVGVAAHERKTMRAAGGETFPATKLQVVAVSRAWQGRSFPSGERASDVVMSALMEDVRARVHCDALHVVLVNEPEDAPRLVAVCRRHGLVEELSRMDDAQYRVLVTKHKAAR
jgi:hypothetical protein